LGEEKVHLFHDFSLTKRLDMGNSKLFLKKLI
jgi:hypothetical protein